MSDNVNLTGFKELEAALKKLPQEMAQKVIRKGALSGIGVMRKAAKGNVPQRRGNLMKKLRAKMKKGSLPWEVVYQLGATKAAFYGLFLEFGTKPHVIVPRKTSRTKDGVVHKALGKDAKFGVRVNHPGIKPIRWLTRAFDQNIQAAIEQSRKVIARELEKVAKGLPKGPKI
jgi:HK97 gp10 family phage protein